MTLPARPVTDTLPLFTPPLVHADATDRQAACSVLLPLLKSCCGTPAALVVAIEHDVCRVVCSTGWLGPREMPRVLSFSGRAAMHGGLFEISDLAASRISAQKISAHPHVDARIIGTTTEPSLAASVRFYAAQPICSNTGQVLGALCVADSRPHKLDATQKEALHALAGIATQLLEASLHEARARSQAVRVLHLERDLAQAREHHFLHGIFVRLEAAAADVG